MARDRSLDEFAVDAASGAADQESKAGGNGSSADGEGETDGSAEEQTQGSAEEQTQDPAEKSTDVGTDRSAASIGGTEVEPATATYQWDPEGLECPDCGRTVDRVWIQGDERVCSDCKEW